jgi:RNA polymerase sigma-54 factor
MSTNDLPGLDQTLSTSESLTEHLMEQVRLSGMNEEEQTIATLIIGNLDEAGYLRNASVEEIALDAGSSVEDVEFILTIVQEFDPLGVGARDLRECLLIQLDKDHPENELARRVVEDHIPNLERKSYTRIAKDLSVDLQDVYDTARLISTLEPKPGREYADDDARYITPDIYIYYIGGEYVPVLNEDGMPKLRVSNYYRKELQRKKEAGEKDEVKDYIQDKLRGAMWLIRSIHQRQSTILKVTDSIIKFQKNFFEDGVEHLRPLVLRDVADDIGMHESTVSRVTTNKYVHTPRGTFELKYFFNSSITNTEGDDLASEAVKAKIREILAHENQKKPLSDAKIVKELAKEGIDIARRTVAKYREMMGILSSTKRKQVF